MSARQAVRRYVALVAKHGPLAPRLGKLGKGAVADVIDRATLRLCNEGVPHFINPPGLWPFFCAQPSSASTMMLCHRALDAARKRYIKETSVSGGAPLNPTTSKLDTDALANLSRFTEAGQAVAAEPSRMLEQQTQLEAEAAALEYRKQIEAEEVAKLRQALSEYARKLPKKQRRALALVVFDTQLTGSRIAAKCGVAPSTVSKIRANVEELADKILTIAPEEHATAPEAHDEEHDVRDASVEQIAEALDSSAALDLAEILQAPDVDEDVAENVMQGYARRQDLSWLNKDQRWSGGKRMYGDAELVTGNYRLTEWADPARLAEIHQAWSSEYDLRKLTKESDAAGFDLPGTLQDLRSYVAKKEEAARADAKEVGALKSRVRKVARLESRTAAELAQLAEIREWVQPFVRELHRGRDLDSLLNNSLDLPKRSST
jgi:hypothetical protein